MNKPLLRARLPFIGLTIGAAVLALLLAGYGLAGAATATAGVVLAPAGSAQHGARGTTVTYTVQITNTGTAPDIFDLSVSGFHWPTSILGCCTILLPINGHGVITVEVSVPLTATGHDVATLTARSESDNSVSASALLTTTAVMKLYLPHIRKH